jgi:hypothetical protein
VDHYMGVTDGHRAVFLRAQTIAIDGGCQGKVRACVKVRTRCFARLKLETHAK